MENEQAPDPLAITRRLEHGIRYLYQRLEKVKAERDEAKFEASEWQERYSREVSDKAAIQDRLVLRTAELDAARDAIGRVEGERNTYHHAMEEAQYVADELRAEVDRLTRENGMLRADATVTIRQDVSALRKIDAHLGLPRTAAWPHKETK